MFLRVQILDYHRAPNKYKRKRWCSGNTPESETRESVDTVLATRSDVVRRVFTRSGRGELWRLADGQRHRRRHYYNTQCWSTYFIARDRDDHCTRGHAVLERCDEKKCLSQNIARYFQASEFKQNRKNKWSKNRIQSLDYSRVLKTFETSARANIIYFIQLKLKGYESQECILTNK